MLVLQLAFVLPLQLFSVDMAYNTLRLPQKVYLSDIEVYACLLYWITETTVLNVIKYGRIKEVSDLTNELELQIAELKGENAAMVSLNATEQKAKEGILEAKVTLP